MDQVKERLDSLLAKEQELLVEIASEETVLAAKEVTRQEAQRVKALVDEHDKADHMVSL